MEDPKEQIRDMARANNAQKDLDREIERNFAQATQPEEVRQIPKFQDRNKLQLKDITFDKKWDRATKRAYKAALKKCAKKRVKEGSEKFWEIMAAHGFKATGE